MPHNFYDLTVINIKKHGKKVETTRTKKINTFKLIQSVEIYTQVFVTIEKKMR